MMEKANDSFAVVTGASTGIGRAIAGELASRRHNLVLNSLPGQGLADLCRKLESDFGIIAYCAEGDLTAEEGPETLFDFVQQKKLNVDILVNNAGIGYEGPVEGYTKKQIDNMLMLNVRAVTMLTMLFIPGLKKKCQILYPQSEQFWMLSSHCLQEHLPCHKVVHLLFHQSH